MPVTRNQSSVAAKSSSETPSTSGLKESSDGGDKSAEAETSHRDSPENCSICLGPFINKSFTSSCAHSFCFVCLKQWSKVKAECPLCKQPFTGIFHNIRSNDSYDVYELPPINPPHQIDYTYLYNYMGGHLTTFAPTQHYFSLSQPSLDADLTLSNFSRFQFHHRRYNRYLNSDHSVHGEHQYSYPNSTFNPAAHVSAVSWPRGAEDFRLRVYRRHMGPPAVILGCENSNYRLTPAMVAASSHRLHRIMPWLTRELRVLLRSHQNVRLAISIIQPLLTQVTIDSHYFSEKVSPIIGQRSRQFMQEFTAFANSALTLQAFDRKAMYRSRVARILYEDNSSSSSSDDDVIEVTDASPDVRAQSSRNASASLQGADRFSPTPGPSRENIDSQDTPVQIEVDRVSVSSESDPVFRPGLDDSDSDNTEAGSDIVFVKYDKPWSKRSPIQLSSGSDGGEKSRKKKKMKNKKLKKRSLQEVKSSRKGKGHKTAKTRGNCVLKRRVSARNEWHYESESGTGQNIVSTLSSLVKQKKKKHKRSKEKNVDNLVCDNEREQTGRPVDGARHSENVDVTGSGNIDGTGADKRKDLLKKRGRSCDSDKGKRKRRKKKSLTKELTSSSPALISYKKHHSGHKKSTSKSESARRRHQHRHAARIEDSSDSSSRTGSIDREMQASRSQPLASPSVDHSGASTFQASYLARPDTVQHIPLNLWVSTWPSLPHTLPAASPSSSFSTSLPHPLASSSFPSQNLSNTSSEYTSQTISSDSESSTDSDSGTSSDSSSPLPLRARTKRWLDANYSELGLQPSASSAVHTSSAPDVTQIWGIEHISSQSSDANISARHSNNITDIVSVGSDDDDVVICSSTNSDESESDEVRVIEKSNVSVYASSSSSSCGSCATTAGVFRLAQTSYPSQSSIVSLSLEGRHTNGLIQVTSAPIVSAQTYRKSNCAEQTLNPVVSRMTSSPGSNVDMSMTSQQSQQPEITSSQASNSIQDSQPASSASELKSVLTSVSTDSGIHSHNIFPLTSVSTDSGIHHHNIFPLTSAGLLDTAYRTSTSIPPTSVAEDITAASMHSDQSISTPAAAVSSSMFGVLPLHTSAPVTSILSSNLNYLPYPPLPLSTNLPSLPVPFMVPQPQAPSRLQLHFPFPPIQPLLGGASSLFAPVYAGFSQASPVASTSSAAVDTARPFETSVADRTAAATLKDNTENITNAESDRSIADKPDAFSEITDLAPALITGVHNGRHRKASSSLKSDDLSVVEDFRMNKGTTHSSIDHLSGISACDVENAVDIFESMSGLSSGASVVGGSDLFQQPREENPQCSHAEILHRQEEFDAFNILDDVHFGVVEATDNNNCSNIVILAAAEGDSLEAYKPESTASSIDELLVADADRAAGVGLCADRLVEGGTSETLENINISDEPFESVFDAYESLETENEPLENLTSMNRPTAADNLLDEPLEMGTMGDDPLEMVNMTESLETVSRMNQALKINRVSHSLGTSAMEAGESVARTLEALDAITDTNEAMETSVADMGYLEL